MTTEESVDWVAREISKLRENMPDARFTAAAQMMAALMPIMSNNTPWEVARRAVVCADALLDVIHEGH